MTQSPHKLYAEILCQFGFGYPLWIPGPSETAPSAYHSRGVDIGDVGIKHPDGALDFLFSTALPPTDDVNLHGVPHEFEPLPIAPSDLNVDSYFFPQWTYIGDKCVKDVNVSLGVSANPL